MVNLLLKSYSKNIKNIKNLLKGWIFFVVVVKNFNKNFHPLHNQHEKHFFQCLPFSIQFVRTSKPKTPKKVVILFIFLLVRLLSSQARRLYGDKCEANHFFLISNKTRAKKFSYARQKWKEMITRAMGRIKNWKLFFYDLKIIYLYCTAFLFPLVINKKILSLWN
jgi:hypothetical protein